MPKHILLVDDNPAVRTATKTYLQLQADFTICGEACDGIEAVEKALELSPDLIVMDLSMPRMNGLEAARKLTKQMPHVPIVLLTSYKSVLSDSDAAAAGISAVVSKVDGPKLLKTEIQSLLDMPLDVFLARRHSQSSNRRGFGY